MTKTACVESTFYKTCILLKVSDRLFRKTAGFRCRPYHRPRGEVFKVPLSTVMSAVRPEQTNWPSDTHKEFVSPNQDINGKQVISDTRRSLAL